MTTYRWLKQGPLMVLYENGTTHPFDRKALETALEVERNSEPPPGVCSFRFYRRRTNNIAKFKQGIELLNND
jgi:hypothetical protein